MAKPAKPNRREPMKDPPHCERGDEVYFKSAGGPLTGKVLARGAHGITVDAGGKQHKVYHEDILGHRQRAKRQLRVVDEGEDGFIAVDDRGKRRYVHDPLDGGDMAKSEGPRLLLFGETPLLKAIANRPGLQLQDRTDKTGRHTKRWVKTDKGKPAERHSKVEHHSQAKAGAEPEYGSHNLSSGDKVTFTAGAFKGEGEIVGKPGKDGAHVRDSAGRSHKVLWSEVTGHKRPEPAGGTEEAPPKDKGGQKGSGGDKGGKPPAPPQDPDAPLFEADALAHLPRSTSQPCQSWEELQAKGTEALEVFSKTLGDVASKLGLRTDVQKPDGLSDADIDSDDGFLFIAPLKGHARAKEKVEGEYDGDWSQVRDMVRASITVSSMAEIRAAVEAVTAAGLTLAQKPKDKFAEPTPEGYRDLNTIVRLPGGMVAELQYHLKPVIAAKVKAHKDYEISRTLQAKYGEANPSDAWSDEDHATFHQATKRQRDAYGEAWKKATGG